MAKNHIFLKTFSSEFQEIEVWFTDHNSQPLKIEDKIKMRHSIEPRDRIYVKSFGFLSFAKTIGTHLSNKFSQKLHYSTKESTTDAIKTVSKRVIEKTAEATGDLICNKVAYKLKNIFKISKGIAFSGTAFKNRW